MTNKTPKLFSTSITKEQAKDSGMAIVLILLLVGYFTKDDLFYRIAVPILLINMIFPMFYYPFAILWFGLSNILGAIVSKILLSVVFFIIVLPVALLRQLFGKDSLLLKKFKKSNKSVMKTRNHTYVGTDLENPF